MMRTRLSAVLICASTLAGCATSIGTTRVERVEIAESVYLTLPSPEELTDSVALTQIISGTYQSRTYTLQVQLEWRPGTFAMAALNSFGALLFSIDYDGARLRTTASKPLLGGLQPEYVLADILMTFWGEPLLSRHLASPGVSVRETANRRDISRDGTPIIAIEYQSASRRDGEIRFKHLERGYDLQIETLSIEQL